MAEERLERDNDLLPAQLPARASINTACGLLEPARGDIFGAQGNVVVARGDPAVLGPQSTTLNEERKCILAELDRVPAATGVIALHPSVLARYEEQLNQLQTGLAKGIATGDFESAEAMRDLIETVTVFRDPSKISGIEVEIAGRLTALLGEEAFPHGVKGVGGWW